VVGVLYLLANISWPSTYPAWPESVLLVRSSGERGMLSSSPDFRLLGFLDSILLVPDLDLRSK